MKQYKLLNPGPACTTDNVKQAMLNAGDVCPREIETGDLMKKVSTDIKELLTSNPHKYECTLLSSSGTGAVEMVISSLPKYAKVLNIINGSYGERIQDMLDVYGIDNYSIDFDESSFNVEYIHETLEYTSDFTHISFVHCETTTGILNPLRKLCLLAKKFDCEIIVDAMSSAFAYPIDLDRFGIHYLCCSSNKMVQGMAGLGMVVVNKNSLNDCHPRSVYLDLKAQTDYFAKTSQMRFTPPVQLINALSYALDELKIETVKGRFERYEQLNKYILHKMEALGFDSLIHESENSIVITSFIEPKGFDFESFHSYLKDNGFVVYPGKVSRHQTFRISNIGSLLKADIIEFIKLVEKYVFSTTRS
jgi:2-aminoethylphosphonate-pyruvate transaminase|tara:strand:+ start:403 stop:1488 length:1086 start_codon:yes stop_codon:yes gene_type:complete